MKEEKQTTTTYYLKNGISVKGYTKDIDVSGNGIIIVQPLVYFNDLSFVNHDSINIYKSEVIAIAKN